MCGEKNILNYDITSVVPSGILKTLACGLWPEFPLLTKWKQVTKLI